MENYSVACGRRMKDMCTLAIGKQFSHIKRSCETGKKQKVAHRLSHAAELMYEQVHAETVYVAFVVPISEGCWETILPSYPGFPTRL